MEILRIENLSFRYPQTASKALDNISFNINSGEFIVVCGQSGCGKTTLLKLIKRQLAPKGEISGKILYCSKLLEELDEKRAVSEIGYVLQNPDNQIVTDKVWHELAFGLENIGIPTDIIRRRVAEMASYFGIQNWFRKKTDELSGGQKQLLNLASVMVMQPKILILDEPTSQLDPIAASDFINTLQKLNREFGITVILAEHRLEEVFPIADRVLLMDKASVLLYDKPENIGPELARIKCGHPMSAGLPSAVRIFNALGISEECPLTVKQGHAFLEKNFSPAESPLSDYVNSHITETAVELKNVWFRYEKALPDILRGVNLKIYKGEFYCILGGNGTGKTTALNVISGLYRAYRGKIIINGKKIKEYGKISLYRENLAFLPQNPQTVFIKDKIYDDLADLLEALNIPKKEHEKKITDIAEKTEIINLLERHPFDLSGGEQQKCALAKILMLNPKILLLDEPTKGLDAYSKLKLSKIFQTLKNGGLTIIMVTHDVEFAAENADRCSLFFDGEILSADTPKKFFAENNFYTTAANRIARSLYPDAVTCSDVIEYCKKNRRSYK